MSWKQFLAHNLSLLLFWLGLASGASALFGRKGFGVVAILFAIIQALPERRSRI